MARHIQALEDELNSRLFHKSHSGYGLTDAGERLLAGAEAIESAYLFAKTAASCEGQAIVGTVRIGAPDGFGSVFLGFNEAPALSPGKTGSASILCWAAGTGLFVPIWLTRRLLRTLGAKLASESQLNSPLLNRLLKLVFEFDLRTSPQLAPPFGVSIFVLAEKVWGRAR